MDKDLKREALKQYLHYFRFWFVAVGVALAAFIIIAVVKQVSDSGGRSNNGAPSERVFDYAQVLTVEEEEKLRKLIARKERMIQSDIILVTISQAVESDSVSWENGMMNMADDFYDQNNFGYDKVHGDGVLLLDNWYEGQKGSWLSTCGRVFQRFGNSEINLVLRAVYDKVDDNPYEAYRSYIEETVKQMTGKVNGGTMAVLILVIPLVALLVFVGMKLKSPLGKENMGANVYVNGGRPVIKAKSDQLVNKFVTTRRIPRNTGGSSGSGGGGGGHVSSGGVSHGGGGMRR